MILVLGLVLFTIVMLVLEWIRADLVALLVVVVIGITEATRRTGLQGVASNAVIAIMTMVRGSTVPASTTGEPCPQAPVASVHRRPISTVNDSTPSWILGAMSGCSPKRSSTSIRTRGVEPCLKTTRARSEPARRCRRCS